MFDTVMVSGEAVIGRDDLIAHVQSGAVRAGEKVNVVLRNGFRSYDFTSVLTVDGDDVVVDYEGEKVALYSPNYNSFTLETFKGLRYHLAAK